MCACPDVNPLLPLADDPKEAIEEAKLNRSEPFFAPHSKQVQTVDFPTTANTYSPPDARQVRNRFLQGHQIARCVALQAFIANLHASSCPVWQGSVVHQ